MSSTSKPTVPLSQDLNSFIYGISRRNFQNAPELAKTGISLLKNFPAARDAVLEYFAMVFQDAIAVSVNQCDFINEKPSCPSLEAVNIIGPDLCVLGEAWAPFMAPWCITLLKDIASKGVYSNVNLQNFDPVRILLDIVTQNLTLLNSEERAQCIDVLLASSQCEWVIGAVGRVEPWLVVPRALQLERSLEQTVAILHHLPASHHHHVKKALHSLFYEAIQEDSKSERKKDIIPYLLELAAKSDIVLNALTQDIEEILTESVVLRIVQLVSSLKMDTLSPPSLVNLLMRADISTFFLLLKNAKEYVFCRQLLEYFLQKLEHESLYPDNNIPLLNSAADQIGVVRERLLTGVQLEQYSVARILILVGHRLCYEFVNNISFLLQYSRNDTTLALLVRIISGTFAMHSPSDSTDVLFDHETCQRLLKDGVENALRDSMTSDHEIKRCFVEDNIIFDNKTYLHHFCLNIIKLLRWENSNKVSHLKSKPITKACEANLHKLSTAFDDIVCLLRVTKPCTMSSLNEIPTAHVIAQLLDRLDITGAKSPAPSVEVIMKLVPATVKYFLRCLHIEDIIEKMQGTQTACRLLRKLCLHSKLARAIALRELLERAIFREEVLFGAKADDSPDNEWNKEDLLLYMNQKQGSITQLTQSHTSVFHAGIIGKGAKNAPKGETPNIPSIFTTNIELFLGALMSCMEGGGMVEGMTTVSLLLVELISPDVMYNGLPWPDDDFTKQLSVERELYMRGALQSCAMSRGALRRAAKWRPALCLSSVLLRACAATVLHRARAQPPINEGKPIDQTSTKEMAIEQDMIRELLDSMSLGQLLPHPLSLMTELLPHISPIEVMHVLRDCLWNYTRDHVPSPALFPCDSSGIHWRDPATNRPPSVYTDTMRNVIQKHICQLGHLYPIMFLILPKTEK